MESTQSWIIFTLIIVLLLLIVSLSWNRNLILSRRIGSDLKKIKQILTAYYLPETWLKVDAMTMVEIKDDGAGAVSSTITQQAFKVTTQTRSDTERAYVVEYCGNPFSNAEIDVSVGEQGLLETAKVIADDQTSQIISVVAGAPGAILQPPTKSVASFTDNRSKASTTVQKFEETFYVRASDTASKDHEVTWERPVIVAGKPVDASFKINSTLAAANAVSTGPHKGLVFRMRTNADVTLKSAVPGNVKVAGINFFDKNREFVVPMRTTPFVKRVQTLTISNGELIKHELANPSWIKGFITIPVDLAKAIVAIPAQLISLRIDTTKRQKDLENEKLALDEALLKRNEFEMSMVKKENELLEAQKKLVKTEAMLNQVKINAAEEIARLDNEIEQLTQERKK